MVLYASTNLAQATCSHQIFIPWDMAAVLIVLAYGVFIYAIWLLEKYLSPDSPPLKPRIRMVARDKWMAMRAVWSKNKRDGTLPPDGL